MNDYSTASGERRLGSNNRKPTNFLLPRKEVLDYLKSMEGLSYNHTDPDADVLFPVQDKQVDDHPVYRFLGLDQRSPTVVVGRRNKQEGTDLLVTDCGAIMPFLMRRKALTKPSGKGKCGYAMSIPEDRKLVVTGGACLFGGDSFVARHREGIELQSSGTEERRHTLNALYPDERQVMYGLDPEHLVFEIKTEPRHYHRVLSYLFSRLAGELGASEAWYHIPDAAYGFTMGNLLSKREDVREKFQEHVEKIKNNLRSSLPGVQFYKPDPNMVCLLAIAMLRSDGIEIGVKPLVSFGNRSRVIAAFERAEYVAFYAETLLRNPNSVIFNVDDLLETGIMINVDRTLNLVANTVVYDGLVEDIDRERKVSLIKTIEENYGADVSMDKVKDINKEMHGMYSGINDGKQSRLAGVFLAFPCYDGNGASTTHPYVVDVKNNPPYLR